MTTRAAATRKDMTNTVTNAMTPRSLAGEQRRRRRRRRGRRRRKNKRRGEGNGGRVERGRGDGEEKERQKERKKEEEEEGEEEEEEKEERGGEGGVAYHSTPVFFTRHEEGNNNMIKIAILPVHDPVSF